MPSKSYTQIAQLLYEGYSEIIGEAAEGIIKDDDNVKVNDKGEIEEFSGNREDLQHLVEEFQDTIGEVAIRIGKKKVGEELDDENQEDLPDIIRGDN